MEFIKFRFVADRTPTSCVHKRLRNCSELGLFILTQQYSDLFGYYLEGYYILSLKHVQYRELIVVQ